MIEASLQWRRAERGCCVVAGAMTVVAWVLNEKEDDVVRGLDRVGKRKKRRPSQSFYAFWLLEEVLPNG